MFGLDAKALVAAVNGDPEFGRWARGWSATVGLASGSDAYVLSFENGTLAGAARGNIANTDIRLSAPETAWREFLKPVPPPFYQGMLPAMVRRGFVLEGDAIAWTAHYGALRRVFAMMRTLPQRGG